MSATLPQSPASSQPESELTGLNVCLMGPAGTGKTYSIGTLVDSGLEVFVLMLESGLESLLGYWTDRNLPVPDNLHYHRLAAPKAGFKEAIENAKKINTMPLDSLAKMVDANRGKHDQFVQLLTVLSDFPDDRTGQKYGDVSTWGVDRALVIDGLAGIGRAAMSLVIGGKPVRNQSDWGIAQDQVEKLLRQLCDDCPCHFFLLSHVERETDQVMGGVKIMVSTLGQKLAPKLPVMFSEVILTVRNGATWTWDTASGIADVKTRNLPITATNPPDFRPIVAKWKKRAGIA